MWQKLLRNQPIYKGGFILETYWNDRFSKEGMIWGQEPSKTVYGAMDVFKNNHVKTVLVPGSGYGRNTKALSALFRVDGIELSNDAITMVMKWDPKSQFIWGSVLNPFIGNKKYDAIYCFDVLHLFLEHDRKKLIHNCTQQ
ncbi:class I SAM-dependent methyltransferase [Paenibacillus sp. S-38]|uniref:class I SAM-dependent methyltransferase n=1 Tax=Paenibacillus sp. S-38 TaxID=3416710 RepID=UPI003CF53F62